MSAADAEWRGLLRDYEVAIAEFESVAHALAAALVEQDAVDGDFHALALTEERAREAVIFTRTRLINLWRESATAAPAPGPR